MTSHTATDSNNPGSGNKDGVVLQGYHKKLKTMKKKYFVLFCENGGKSARLEYYDSEKKFKARSNPKRTITLKNCFNINRRLDTKHNYVIALSTKEEVFCIVLETEMELNEWLRTLLALQRGEDTESDAPKPFFEHVWQVQVQRKGSAEEKGIIGKYYVCLTAKSVTLVRIGSQQTTLGENRLASVEFYLTTIRRCGDSQCFFYMEVGRHSAIGAGELWMQTEDPLIAQNMHTMIISAMSSSKNIDDGFAPVSRKRALSANEASKPIAMLHRRQTHSGNKPINSSPLSESPSATSSTISSTSTVIQNPIIKPSTSKVLELSQSPVSTNNLNPSTATQQHDLTIPRQSGFTLGRDRCDSLPSRNRTTSESSNSQLITNSSMPPPSRPTIPNRPLSMCINSRRSHSPPLNTLSPSTGCSESDGSSLSIDEPDSFVHSMTPDESGNFVGRYFNSHSSGGVIPEENCDDTWFMDKTNTRVLDNMNNAHGRLSLPVSSAQNVHNLRKSSPAVSQAGSVDMQCQYMDMFSPYSPPGTSPCEKSGSGYMPVSPTTDYPRGLYTGSSGGHSRASSLAEETVDGYVPMCPPPIQDYVDMEQSSKHHIGGGLSSAASTCSITSGTPSTDIRFAEYPLDKVKSRFTPDDEDLHPSGERPIRAYSVGSRPEHIKRKLRVDAINMADQTNSRVRAFSVGSRAKVPRCDLYRGVFGPSLIFCNTNNNNLNNNTLNDTIDTGNNKSNKSSSAPILVHKSQNSVDRMGDLMEIDFSKNSENSNHYTVSNSRISQPQNNSYSHAMAASTRFVSFPSSIPSVQQKHESFENSLKENAHSYMVMKLGSFKEKSSPSSDSKSIDSSGYLEMRPIGATKISSLSSSPIKASTSAPKSLSGVHDESDYMNMSPGTSACMQRINSEDYMNLSSRDRHSEREQRPTKATSSSDGYMKMSFSKGQNDESTYISDEQKCEHGSNKLVETRNVSSPIDIISKEKVSGLSLCGSFSKLGRRSDSHDSDIGPISSHCSNIFPFSPENPAKCFIQSDYTQRKCFVDATSGTITLPKHNLTTETVCDFLNASSASTVDSIGVQAGEEKILNTDCSLPKKTFITSVDALTNDYADMSLGSTNNKTSPKRNKTSIESENNDYVNYKPSIATITTPVKVELKHDYTIMSHKTTKKISPKATPIVFPNKKQPLVTIATRSTESTSFKPISTYNDELLMKNNKRGANSPKSVNRQSSDQHRGSDDNSSGYELLQMRSDSSLQTKKIISRPNSVNSEKISPSRILNRPNSANSECMPSISTSSSTSTLCGSSSSSSTLCGSKSQSPLTSSRPPSFSDGITAGTTSCPESTSSKVDLLLSSRPPSVSSERELHYVSLDLPPASSTIISSTTNNTDGSSTTNHPLAKGSSSNSGESSTSPSPNTNGHQQQSTFSYAQIDFNKSESLKLSMNITSHQKN